MSAGIPPEAKREVDTTVLRSFVKLGSSSALGVLTPGTIATGAHPLGGSSRSSGGKPHAATAATAAAAHRRQHMARLSPRVRAVATTSADRVLAYVR